MAIAITEILGTDSLSGSRLVLNDNFNILASEINAIETYFNPTAGIINNLNNLTTQSLRVGINSPLLDINANTFSILTSIVVSGNIRLDGAGLIRDNTNPQTLDDILASPLTTIAVGTSTTPPAFTIERVGNSNGAPTLVIQLNDGIIGQEIFFVYSKATTGAVEIEGAINSIIGNGGTTILLDQQGETVHLLCVDDGTGNGDWYVVGGSGYTIS
jgi:hypothetical protein